MTIFNKIGYPIKAAATALCFGVGMLWVLMERA